MPTINNEAYEAYLKGKSYSYNPNQHDLDLALKYFELAIEKDPEYDYNRFEQNCSLFLYPFCSFPNR